MRATRSGIPILPVNPRRNALISSEQLDEVAGVGDAHLERDLAHRALRGAQQLLGLVQAEQDQKLVGRETDVALEQLLQVEFVD
ncbi:MAG: hypothetical protein VB067_12120, partial [Christensenellaceae bacterium]|nr:hypothetical protein [Christensenellaceae bacterium]